MMAFCWKQKEAQEQNRKVHKMPMAMATTTLQALFDVGETSG